jgi:hypothetical protein
MLSNMQILLLFSLAYLFQETLQDGKIHPNIAKSFKDCVDKKKRCYGASETEIKMSCIADQSCSTLITISQPFTTPEKKHRVAFEMIWRFDKKHHNDSWVATGLESENSEDVALVLCVYYRDDSLVTDRILMSNGLIPNGADRIRYVDIFPGVQFNGGQIKGQHMTCKWERDLYTNMTGLEFDLLEDDFRVMVAHGPTGEDGKKY